jgi:tRNA(fMet)-specific endonuclease VapC
MTYLLETSVAIHVLRGNETIASRLEALLRGEEAAVSACTVAELLYGVERAVAHTVERDHVARFLQAFTVLPFDVEAARAYAHMEAGMRQLGQRIPVMDALIAATALSHGLTILTADEHFRRVPQLRVENWLEAPAADEDTP